MQTTRVVAPGCRECPACAFTFPQQPIPEPYLVSALVVWRCPRCTQQFEEVRQDDALTYYWLPAEVTA